MPLINHPISSSPPSNSSITLQLDSPDLVLRALSGNESSGQSASLSGTLQLQLSESTHLKDLSLNLRSIAKIDYLEPLSGKRFHHLHPIFFHQFSFLPLNIPLDSSPPSSSTNPTQTYTTLQAGLHRFPFSINLPSDLPASLRTYSGSGLIYYKLKAIATRAGFLTNSKWETKQILRVARSFPVEAVEWNQTLEIENTWPGKVSYEISLPHKAFAAGDRIPVSLKFSPLMKGVRVTSLVTTIKEHVALVGKAGTPPHIENRDVAQCKYEFIDQKSGGSEPLSRSDPIQGSTTNHSISPRRHLSSSDLTLLTNRLNAVSLSNRRPSFSGLPSPSRSVFGGHGSSNTTPLAELATSEELMASISDDVALSQDIDTIIELTIPSWTTPSHSLAPITVTHKLKFSAFIINPDGHTSELRCALPLHILASHLASEASIASAGARTLLFDPSGNLSQGFNQSVELPSYPEHVRDRLASQEHTSTSTSSLIPAPWITSTTPGSTPPVSTPASPSTSAFNVPGYFPEPGTITSPSPAWTPSHDTEFIRSLDASATYFNPIQPTLPQSSNNSSRASSPGLGTVGPDPNPLQTSTTSSSGSSTTSIGNGFFQIHLPKIPHRNRAPKALTAMRNTSSASSSVPMGAQPTNLSSSTNAVLPTPLPETERELMSRVPSYSIASRGSLGGGPVPISSLIGLPSYEESSGAAAHPPHDDDEVDEEEESRRRKVDEVNE
ncbi:hypothetical protein DFH28DRAFT_986596 [Melampsora americana]|nr:hypothetical protein DFH28DRAFT_986596 [Melampsora americana]